MDELSRKFRAIDWKGLQKSARKVQASTASALKDMVMTDLENKTRAATADTSWGASGTDLMQIAQGTYRREDYALIMSIVWQRLASSRWRCVHKSLELLRHLIMHGAARCAEEARMALPHLHALQQYHALDETGRDVGEAVRRRAKLVCDMLDDSEVLEEERAKSRELRSKLQGSGGGVGVGGIGIGSGVSSEDFRRGSGPSYASGDGPSGGVRIGTASFKGYGDDGDGGDGGEHSSNNPYGYDAAPSGAFAARAAAAAGKSAGGDGAAAALPQPFVGDLLGDDGPGPVVPAIAPAGASFNGGNDDDDDFDPRGGGSGSGAVDVLGDLSGPAGGAAAVPAHATSSGLAAAAGNGTKDVPLSQLVSSLAAQQTASSMQVALVGSGQGNGEFSGFGNEDAHTTTPGQQQQQQQQQQQAMNPFSSSSPTAAANNSPDGVAMGNTFAAAVNGNGMGGDETEGPKRVLSRASEKEKDPFADLLETGKKKGVL